MTKRGLATLALTLGLCFGGVLAFADSSSDTPASAILPKQAYFSSVGAFALNGSSGDAVFTTQHELGDVDAHCHKITYAGQKLGKDGIRYWVYCVEKHPGMRIYFAQRANPAAGEGFRIFYLDHGEVHLWDRNASVLPLHVH